MKSRAEQWIRKETRDTGKSDMLIETIERMVYYLFSILYE